MEIATACVDEAERLEALYSLHLLDTPAEERFDRWTRLAQQYFDVPISLVCLVDVDRQWFKSKQGLDASETDRSISFCGHAIKDDDLFIVEDASLDPRFIDNPLVIGPPHIRFYAAKPLHSGNGRRIGTFCLIDSKPRRLSEKERLLLEQIGTMVEQEFTLHAPGKFRLLAQRSDNILGKFRDIVRPLQNRVAAALVSSISFIFILSIASAAEQQREQQLQAEADKALFSELVSIRGEIETALNAKLYLVQGLSGLVHANPQISETSFLQFARALGDGVNGIRSLQLAPDGIVRYVWPQQTNRAAIGHNLLGDEDRRAAANKAISSRKLWLAGPVTLLQGGQALIGRQAVFLASGTADEHFWGFATVLVDIDALIAEAGLDDFGQRYRFALRGVDAVGNTGDTFYGDASVFDNRAIQTTVTLPAGSWVIAAEPEPQPRHATAWLSIILGSFLVSILLYNLLRLPANLRRAAANASAALARSEGRFKDAIEALPDGFVIYDASDRIVVSNKKMRDLYPESAQALRRNTTFEEFLREGIKGQQYTLRGSDTDFVQTHLGLHHQDAVDWEFELGDNRWIHVVENRMRDGGKVGFHRDITAQKLQQAQLLDAKQRAEHASEAKTRFLATISHELRTPLNGVLGLLSMLYDDISLNSRQRHYAETAHSSAQQLLAILNEILDISKLEAGKQELVLEPFSLVDTLNAAISLQRASIEQKGLELLVDIDPELDTVFKGDPARIRQVLLNLLNNACKFTHSGHIKLTARRADHSAERARIAIDISDTGIGFDGTQAARLFEPFTQLDNQADRQFSGTGLGLAICRQLMTLMGGEINADSRLGHGATFHLRFDLDYAAHAAPLPSKIHNASPTPKQLGWPTKRVLLAEDGATNQLVIKAMLNDTGYTLDIANDGLEAVQAIKNTVYDVALMDIYMPNMDGIAATTAIRTLENGKSLPIIALTANAMPDDREKFINAGMDDYLPKPVTRSDLLCAMYRAQTLEQVR